MRFDGVLAAVGRRSEPVYAVADRDARAALACDPRRSACQLIASEQIFREKQAPMFSVILVSAGLTSLPQEWQQFVRQCGKQQRVLQLDQQILAVQTQISAAMRLPLEEQKTVIPPLIEKWHNAVNEQRILGGLPPLPIQPAVQQVQPPKRVIVPGIQP